jgi:hypothetical protein
MTDRRRTGSSSHREPTLTAFHAEVTRLMSLVLPLSWPAVCRGRSGAAPPLAPSRRRVHGLSGDLVPAGRGPPSVDALPSVQALQCESRMLGSCGCHVLTQRPVSGRSDRGTSVQLTLVNDTAMTQGPLCQTGLVARPIRRLPSVMREMAPLDRGTHNPWVVGSSPTRPTPPLCCSTFC